MLDFQKIKDEWGYAPNPDPRGYGYGNTPNITSGPAPTPYSGGTTMTTPKTSVTKKDSTTTTPTIGGGTPMANTGNNFIYPTEWDNLGDQWGQMA